MSSSPSAPDRLLHERVRAGEPLIGTFVKTTSHQTVEVLGLSGLDFVILDAEHAPFGAEALDRALAVGPAAGLPALVRVPSHDPAFINGCLDMGAAGIMVPHVHNAADVERIADATRYRRGKRGFTPSARAGQYGRLGIEGHLAAADESAMVWCQIEDREALEALDAIAESAEVDCLFIGPVDLALSLGCGASDPPLSQAIREIADAGRRHGRRVGLYVSDTDAIPPMRELGISVFLCGTDQSLLLSGASRIAANAFA